MLEASVKLFWKYYNLNGLTREQIWHDEHWTFNKEGLKNFRNINFTPITTEDAIQIHSVLVCISFAEFARSYGIACAVFCAIFRFFYFFSVDLSDFSYNYLLEMRSAKCSISVWLSAAVKRKMPSSSHQQHRTCQKYCENNCACETNSIQIFIKIYCSVILETFHHT